jgi:hypothetical protein
MGTLVQLWSKAGLPRIRTESKPQSWSTKSVSSLPPFVLAGNKSVLTAKGSQTLPPYKKAEVVYGTQHNYVAFMQMDGAPQHHVSDNQFFIQAPYVSMQANCLLLPTGNEIPADVDDWYVGILQVMMHGEATGFYGRQLDKVDTCNELYFSPPLPLADRISNKKREKQESACYGKSAVGDQQPACDDNPAYSDHASSPASLRDVYAGKNVYCQLSMTDWPSQSFSLYSDRNSEVVLNKVVVQWSFRTMVCAYKLGLGANEVHPLQGVDWCFNATAIRRPTAADKFKFEVPTTEEPAISSFSSNYEGKDKNSLWFDPKWLQIDQSNHTFASPNNSQRWKWVSPTLETRLTSF